MIRVIFISSILALMFSLSPAWAADSPQEVRQEMMEGVGDAAKPVGKMLKGEQEFDAAAVTKSFQVWSNAAIDFGDLFPEGSETGYDTEARETIWTDRDGFNEHLVTFTDAVISAIEDNPQDLEMLKTATGPVFKACKSCHEDYRVEDED